jgi:alginate O-acetyltransferase complex protein AlgI
MIFSSIDYVIFFFVVALAYYIIPAAFRWCWLLLAGIFFYGYSKPAYVLIPVIIILISYAGGIQIEKASSEKKVKQYFVACMVAIVGILVFFKYTNFFSATIVDIINFSAHKIFNSANTVQNNLLISLVAPLGISYITFQAIGYLIEIKRGNHKAERHLGHYATFIFFFPKIVAGPVERAHRFLPQLKKLQPLKYENVTSGLQLALWGLFKKIVIADRLSIYISAVFNNHEHHSGITLFVAALFYIFQMYADFSGYTDMALGFARVLGFDIMQNFNRPLFAKSVTEFWRKWHISLSTWFGDYFYNPIAIEKRHWGNMAIVYASFVTFITLGFWHGANWTFIVFGALQGLILSIEFFTRKQRKNLRKKIPVWLNDVAGNLFTVGYFGFSLIFFRADSVGEATSIIKKIGSFKGPFFYDSVSMFMFVLIGIVYLLAYEIKKEYFNNLFTLSNNRYWLIRNGYYCLMIIIILASGVFDGGEFIYFQF